MRILMVSNKLYPLGESERLMLYTADLLQAQGHTVTWFVCDDKQNMSRPHVYSVSSPGREGWLKRMRRLKWDDEVSACMEEFLRTAMPDLALVWKVSGGLTFSCVDALKAWNITTYVMVMDDRMVCPTGSGVRSGRPCTACSGGKSLPCVLHRCVNRSLSESFTAAAERRWLRNDSLYNIPDGYIVPSAYHREQLLAEHFTQQPILNMELPLPVDCLEPVRNVRGDFFLYSGRLTRQSGVYTLLDAVSRTVTRLPLMISGDGPQRRKLQEYAVSLGITDRIIFRGVGNERSLRLTMAQCTALLVPSAAGEIAPWALLQAQIMGKPAIVADEGVLPSRVTHEKNGIVYDPKDEFALPQAMDQMAGMDRETWQEYSEDAAREAASRYDPEKYVQRITALANIRAGNMEAL